MLTADGDSWHKGASVGTSDPLVTLGAGTITRVQVDNVRARLRHDPSEIRGTVHRRPMHDSRVNFSRVRFRLVRSLESKSIRIRFPSPAGAGYGTLCGEPRQRPVDVLAPASNRTPNRPHRHRNIGIRQTPQNVAVDSLCAALTMRTGQAYVTARVKHDGRWRHVLSDVAPECVWFAACPDGIGTPRYRSSRKSLASREFPPRRSHHPCAGGA